jgi:large subunit ribosomal protein L22e/Meckel syndrome type 1 protein
MKPILFAVSSLLLAPLAFSAAPAHAATAARNYDCAKAGNVNKTVCKNAAAAKPAPAAKARNYDCSKPGNANKAVCKSVATPPTTVTTAPTTTVTKTTRNYDCSKAGNANKTVCKGAATTTISRPAPSAPVSRPAPTAPTTRAPAAGQNTSPAGLNGAAAKCRDGTYSHSAHRSGTCSRHGGVAQWY